MMPKRKTKPRPAPTRKPCTPPRGACLMAGPGLHAVVTADAVQALTQEGLVILPRVLAAVTEHRAGRTRRTEHAVGKVTLHVLSGAGGVIVAAASDLGEAAA